ncbi:MAG: acyltransferase [Planctomycetes bacterium]|nr:acyltransferase [Planctomycetota bacterium]
MEKLKGMSAEVKVAWAQACSQGSFENNAEYYLSKCQELAKQGAELIFLPELFLWDYFAIREDMAVFDQAITLDSPTLKPFKECAQLNQLTLFLPIFEKRAPGVYHNTVVAIGPQGEMLDFYRKMHIPDDPCFYEKYYFSPGDTGFKVIATPKLNVGILICWDQWFPEAARLTAMKGADLLYYPTAIAWDQNEPGEIYEEQCDSWRVINRSHSIANGVYSLAVNRVGTQENLTFWGNSQLTHPTGRVMSLLGSEEGSVLMELDPSAVEAHRKAWPFFRDRRIDAYGDLLKRWGDS